MGSDTSRQGGGIAIPQRSTRFMPATLGGVGLTCCGGPGRDGDGDSGTVADGAAAQCGDGVQMDRVERATPSPDGMGYCCAPAEHHRCGCEAAGGFTEDPCECGTLSGAGTIVCDVAPIDWIPMTDSHGCESYVANPSPTTCCNCPPDAGASNGDAGAS